jgi:hypothetical protein
MGRINGILPFDTTLTAQKKEKKYDEHTRHLDSKMIP